MSPPSGEVRQAMERIEALLAVIDREGGTACDRARQLVSAVLELHGAAMAAILNRLADYPAAREACLDDDLVANLLILHGLHPEPVEARIARALQAARARVGGSLELVALDERRLRVRAAAVGAASPSAAEIRQAVEEAVSAVAPDAPAIEVIVADAAGRIVLPLAAVAERAT